jgi:gliding motility-associated-like protein
MTPTTQDPNATVKVNGTTVTSGTASASIPLATGANTITTVVTAQDGTTSHTYSITVTRAAPSKDALLSTIKLTPASALANTGTSGTTTTYTTSVGNAETSVTVTPTAQDANAIIKVNGVGVTSGTASGSIALAVGQTTINTVVTAQDGTTTRTYSITVTRATGPLMSLYLPASVVQPTDRAAIENDGILVHQGLSPNGDGINDVLTIDGITQYPNNQLTIIDRSGSLIYQAKGYNTISKVFDGHSSINDRLLQPGTYFYSLDYVVNGQSKHKTGFILLKY